MSRIIEGQNSKYLLTEKTIGQGGMGTIYIGSRLERNGREGEQVAIKKVNKQTSHGGDNDNYDQELEITKKLIQYLKDEACKFLINFYDISVGKDFFYIITQFYEQGDFLGFLIKKRELCTYETVLDILIQMTIAIQYLHDHSIVHRDLKPENILIARENSLLFIKVADFGVASDNHKSICAGTPNYMAPELVKGQDHNESIDIWSFGCIAYEIITGNQYFGGSNVKQIVKQISTYCEPSYQNQNQNDIYYGIHQIIKKYCLQPDQNKRKNAKFISEQLLELKSNYMSDLKDFDYNIVQSNEVVFQSMDLQKFDNSSNNFSTEDYIQEGEADRKSEDNIEVSSIFKKAVYEQHQENPEKEIRNSDQKQNILQRSDEYLSHFEQSQFNNSKSDCYEHQQYEQQNDQNSNQPIREQQPVIYLDEQPIQDNQKYQQIISDARHDPQKQDFHSQISDQNSLLFHSDIFSFQNSQIKEQTQIEQEIVQKIQPENVNSDNEDNESVTGLSLSSLSQVTEQQEPNNNMQSIVMVYPLKEPCEHKDNEVTKNGNQNQFDDNTDQQSRVQSLTQVTQEPKELIFEPTKQLKQKDYTPQPDHYSKSQDKTEDISYKIKICFLFAPYVAIGLTALRKLI